MDGKFYAFRGVLDGFNSDYDFPIAPAELVRREEPEYPAIADKYGTVKLKIWISPNGSVRRLEYVGGHPLLAESALKAVKAWKYETNSKETTATVELRF